MASTWLACQVALLPWVLWIHRFRSVSGATAGAVTDLRFAARRLIRRPLFTVLATLAMGLGIGAATTVCSITQAILFSPGPFEEPHRLVNLWPVVQEEVGGRWRAGRVSWGEFVNLRERVPSLGRVAIYAFAEVARDDVEIPEIRRVGEASASLSATLGLEPILGRWFRPEESGPAFQRVAVLSEEYWRGRLGADPRVLGSTLNLQGESYEVWEWSPPDST